MKTSALKSLRAAGCKVWRRLAGCDKHALAAVVILAVGILLRTIRFGNLPPGLYNDEAWNGIDAVSTLREGLRVFYPNNFGREPLFIWLTTLPVALLGPTPTAVRLPALILGSASLPACYLLTRELLGRRIALWALAVMAFTLWPIQLSRIGFRVVALPFFLGLAIYQVVKGCKTGRLWHWLMGGLLYGAAFYTYVAVRFTPVAIAAFLLYLVATRQFKPSRSLLYGSLVFVVTLAITILPLAVYAGAHPDAFLLRMGQTSIFAPSSSPNGWADGLARSLVGTLEMFNVRGDAIARHNLPLRPVFDVLMGAAFLLGCYEGLRRFRRIEFAFVLIWVAVMLGPTILTVEAPHFLRAAGVWPIVAILPAWGLDRIWQTVERRVGFRRAAVVIGVLVLASLSVTVYAYFVRYPQVSELADSFQVPATHLAGEVNSFLQVGWTQGAMSARGGSPRADRRVYIDRQVWKDWLPAHFLIPHSMSLVIPGTPSEDASIDHAVIPTLLVAWEHPDYPGYWLSSLDWLPRRSKIELRERVVAITGMLPEPHFAYLVLEATPYQTQPSPLAQLESGIELVESDVQWRQERLYVRLGWRARQPLAVDYTVFVHVEQEGQLVAQYNDGPWGGCQPMEGCFPTTRWLPDDVVVDELQFTLPQAWDPQRDRIWVGMYHKPEMQRLAITHSRLRSAEGRLLIAPFEAVP